LTYLFHHSGFVIISISIRRICKIVDYQLCHGCIVQLGSQRTDCNKIWYL